MPRDILQMFNLKGTIEYNIFKHPRIQFALVRTQAKIESFYRDWDTGIKILTVVVVLVTAIYNIHGYSEIDKYDYRSLERRIDTWTHVEGYTNAAKVAYEDGRVTQFEWSGLRDLIVIHNNKEEKAKLKKTKSSIQNKLNKQ